MARNWEMLNRVQAICKEIGSPEVFVAPHDVSKPDECVDVIRKTVEALGGKSICFIACLG